MIHIFDSDHMTFLRRGGAEGLAIRNRLRSVAPEDTATTIISYEEQTRGWLAEIARVATLPLLINRYADLKQILIQYSYIAVLDFDEAAASEYETLRKQFRRQSAMDLRIAAIVLANDAILLTRNCRDFEKIAGLHIEDWTI